MSAEHVQAVESLVHAVEKLVQAVEKLVQAVEKLAPLSMMFVREPARWVDQLLHPIQCSPNDC